MAPDDSLKPEELHAAILKLIHLAASWDHDRADHADPNVRAADEKFLTKFVKLVRKYDLVGKQGSTRILDKDLIQLQYVQLGLSEIPAQLSNGKIDDSAAQTAIIEHLNSCNVHVSQERIERVGYWAEGAKPTDGTRWVGISARMGPQQ